MQKSPKTYQRLSSSLSCCDYVKGGIRTYLSLHQPLHFPSLLEPPYDCSCSWSDSCSGSCSHPSPLPNHRANSSVCSD